MYKLCKTEQSAARQRDLEQGLLRQLRTTRYEDISVSDLCDELQVPRKSFYRYFSSKEGALYALLDHTLMEFYDAGYARNSAGSHLGDLDQFFVFWYDHRELLDALSRSQLSGLLVERATNLVQQEKLMPMKLLNMPERIQTVAMSFAVCGLLSMVIQWHHQGFPVPPAEMSAIAKDILTQPLIYM